MVGRFFVGFVIFVGDVSGCFTKHEEHVRAYGLARTPPLSQTYPVLFVLVKCRRSEPRWPNTTKPDVILTTS